MSVTFGSYQVLAPMVCPYPFNFFIKYDLDFEKRGAGSGQYQWTGPTVTWRLVGVALTTGPDWLTPPFGVTSSKGNA